MSRRPSAAKCWHSPATEAVSTPGSPRTTGCPLRQRGHGHFRASRCLTGSPSFTGSGPCIEAGSRMMVIDASVTLDAMLSPGGLDALAHLDLVSPPLMWSEATSALREVTWRGLLGREAALVGLERLANAPIEVRSPGTLHREAWSLAEELRWAKTYDAEYVALA